MRHTYTPEVVQWWRGARQSSVQPPRASARDCHWLAQAVPRAPSPGRLDTGFAPPALHLSPVVPVGVNMVTQGSIKLAVELNSE